MPSQSELIDIMTTVLAGWPDVRAVGLGGSLSRGPAPAFTDVDLFILIREKTLRSVQTQLHAAVIERWPVVAYVNRGAVDSMGHMQQFVFDDLTMLDTALLAAEESERFEFQRRTKVLFERDGAMSDILRTAGDFADIDEKQRLALLQHHHELFCVFAVVLAKSIRKRERWLAVHHLDRLRNCFFTIARLSMRSFTPLLRRGESGADNVLPAAVRERLRSYRADLDLRTVTQSALALVDAVRLFGIGETAMRVIGAAERAILHAREQLEQHT